MERQGKNWKHMCARMFSSKRKSTHHTLLLLEKIFCRLIHKSTYIHSTHLVLTYSDYSIIRISNVIFSSRQKALLSQAINWRWQGWCKLQGVGTFYWQASFFNIMNFLVLCFGCFWIASVIFFFRIALRQMLNHRWKILLLTAFRQEIYNNQNVSSLIPMLDKVTFATWTVQLHPNLEKIL